MQSDLLAGAEVTIPKVDNLHASANREFIKTFNPETDRVDKLLAKRIVGDLGIQPVTTSASS